MLNKIIGFSLQNRILVLVASVLLLIGGTYTAMHTEVDVFPDLNAPTVVIMTEANGMAAEEVEQLVTFPVETAVNGATGVRRVRSSSTNGFSVVWVEFDWDTDIYLARQIVSEKLAVVSESLPANVGKPTLGPQSSILGEMLIVGLTADSTSMLDLRTIADWTIRPRLLSTGGVAQVAVLGGDIKEYQVQLDPDNAKPIFCTHNVYDYGTSKVVGRDQEHIKLELVDNKSNNVMNGIAFGQSSHVRFIKTKRSFDICYSIEENTHKRGEVQLQIEDIKPN